MRTRSNEEHVPPADDGVKAVLEFLGCTGFQRLSELQAAPERTVVIRVRTVQGCVHACVQEADGVFAHELGKSLGRARPQPHSARMACGVLHVL